MVNLLPVTFIGGPKNQVRTGNIQGAWDPDRLVAVLVSVGVTLEKALSDIGMNAKREVIYLECDCEKE